MSRLERQLREDRLLRDAAQTLLKADIDRVRGELERKTIGQRALARAKDGAAELLDNARDKAGGNIGVIALLAGAIALWFARNPVLALFSTDAADEHDNPQPPTGDER